ncbi:MAG: MSMEG_0565 family glycosyltransferase [Mycobacteriales bacterium]
MRVQLLTYSTRPRGSVVHTLALAEALAALGEQVSVVGLGRSGDTSFFRSVDPRVEVQVVPLPDVAGETVEARIWRSIAVLGAAVRPGEADVVHAQDCIAANAVEGACVRTVHHLEAFTTPALVACHDRAVRTPYQLVCVSEPVAREVLADYGREATVIPNGVDADRFADVDSTAVAAWRDRLGGAPLVVALGGIEPRKGTHDLVEAMALLGAEARLVIGGGETLFDYRDYRVLVEATMAVLGLEVEVLGPLAHEDVPPLLACADVVAMPSIAEGFGLTALEALAAGTPVVVRDLPVFREVFGHTVRYAADPAGIAEQLALAAALPYDAAPGQALARSLRWEAAARAHQETYARSRKSSPRGT